MTRVTLVSSSCTLGLDMSPGGGGMTRVTLVGSSCTLGLGMSNGRGGCGQ